MPPQCSGFLFAAVLLNEVVNFAATDGIPGALHEVHVKNLNGILSPRQVQQMYFKGP